MNWHLFDIMDIIQYSTGDTLHLAVAPMINLNVPPMLNNEQMEIPGIPFPDYFNGERVSYGILSNTNIGYIYLFAEWPTAAVDQQFAQAVIALQNTEGLIIDMRLNFGGWALFDEAFDILFNDFTLTIEDAYRLSPTTLTLLPAGNANEFQIDADLASLYDHPIAISLGPTCISMGDVTAQRFRYHPAVRFFGKPPAASLGFSLFIDNIQDWFLRYSISDMFHVHQPGNYLNRAEFPIDYPIWHNPTDAANGIDAVVEAALDWMNNLVYGHDLTIEKKYYSPNTDTLHIQALIENPNSHPISSTVYIHNLDTTFIDSISLSKEMLTSEAEIWSGEGPAPSIEDHFRLSISAYDSIANQEFTIGNVNQFTTIGPVLYDSYVDFLIDPTPPFPKFGFKLVLRNNGQIAPATSVSAGIELYDTTLVKVVENIFQNFGDINPGEIRVSPNWYVFYVDSIPNIIDFKYRLKIYSESYLFWPKDSVDILVGIEHEHSQIPKEYYLYQNYPNPFNPSTTIEFDLPKTSQVTIKIFNILGEEVATLVSGKLSADSYSSDWEARDLASGVYLYRLEAEGFVQTKKMILMK
ncbi:MAG: T9SS type A sorting domain-containing protein, partial [Calditrichia bacterium]|nr:T9SS type A sorting domain-containing protein [Calditrichia bacterium]